MFMASASNEIKIQIGEEVKVLSSDEAIAFNNMRAELHAEGEAIKAEAEARATQKAALLDRLGITEDEAKLLLA
jgi:hypothetical protein